MCKGAHLPCPQSGPSRLALAACCALDHVRRFLQRRLRLLNARRQHMQQPVQQRQSETPAQSIDYTGTSGREGGRALAAGTRNCAGQACLQITLHP